MADLNLLPSDLKANKDVAKTARNLSKITFAIGFLFVVAAAVGGAALFLFTQQATRLSENQQTLRENVSALEDTEQSLILVRDRIQRVQNILSSRGSYESVKKSDDIIANLAENAEFESLEVRSDLSKLTIILKDSDALSNLITELDDTTKYKNITIEDLSFSALLGYQLTVTFY